MSGDDLSYRQIVELLNDHAEQIANDCIPNGRRRGVYWEGDCHGKISVHVAGARQGMVGGWQGQFGDKTGGNLVALIELAMGFESHGEAVRFAKSKYLGITKRHLTPEEKARWAKAKAESDAKAEERKQQAEANDRKRATDVRFIWQEATPLAVTLAEKYLVGRGIDLSEEGFSSWPPSLRFHPGLRLGGNTHPALVGGVQTPDRKLTAIWRIFLDNNGHALTDEQGKKTKLGLGPASGGAVRLGPVGKRLVVAEGIETAMGVQRLTKFPSVWATLSTSGMGGLILPPQVEELDIYSDGYRHRPVVGSEKVDEPPGDKAALKLKQRAEEQGVKVRVFPSPAPDYWLDVYNCKKQLEKDRGEK